MFGVLKKFFLFSGKENSRKFKRSIVISLIDALASALKIPAIMCVLMGVIERKRPWKIYTWFNSHHGGMRS